MKRWIGVLLTLVAFHSQGALLTAQEAKTKSEIYEKYNTEPLLIEINEVQNSTRNLELEREEKAKRLTEYQVHYQQKIRDLEESLLASKRAEMSEELAPIGIATPKSLFQDLETLAGNISQLELAEVTIAHQLAQLTNKLDTLKRDLKRTQNLKDTQLLALRDVIRDRYIKEVSSAKNISYSGSIRCGTNTSIRECMRSVPLEKLVYSEAKKALPVAKVDILDHTYSRFSLDLNGNADFAVNVRYTGTFSADINESITRTLGINAFEVVIVSNRDDAEHFVNGDYIGKGKRVTTTVNAGQNAFYSLAANKKESVVEVINDNRRLTFNF